MQPNHSSDPSSGGPSIYEQAYTDLKGAGVINRDKDGRNPWITALQKLTPEQLRRGLEWVLCEEYTSKGWMHPAQFIRFAKNDSVVVKSGASGDYTMRQFKQAHPTAKAKSEKLLMVDFVETRRDHRGLLVPVLDEDGESQ